MLRLLEFLYQKKIFGLFLLLQGLSIWLLFSYNHRYNTYYLNSSNRIAGEILGVVQNIENYFDLEKINADLALENLELRRSLAKVHFDSQPNSRPQDSSSYRLVLGHVVNSTYRRSKNFLTLRIQPQDSIRPGMGVISAEGVVGRVKSVSTHFATVTSLLNSNLMVSGRVKSNKALCTVQWDELSSIEAELKYVPRHIKLSIGDTVVTSGFNAVFPGGIPIGVVIRNELRQESAFYDSRIRLLTDYSTIQTAYIIQVDHTQELIKLQEELPND